MKNLLKTGVLLSVALVSGCSEKKVETESKGASQSEAVVKPSNVQPIVITNDVANDADLLKLRTKAIIYDAVALPLGENYTSVEQLKNATKLAELTNITHSAQDAKIDEQSCVFATMMIMGEDLKTTDVKVELSYRDMQMNFFTSLRLDSQGFYEMSQSGDSNRMYVVVLTVGKIENKVEK